MNTRYCFTVNRVIQLSAKQLESAFTEAMQEEASAVLCQAYQEQSK